MNKQYMVCKIYPKPGAPVNWCIEAREKQLQAGGGLCKGCANLCRNLAKEEE